MFSQIWNIILHAINILAFNIGTFNLGIELLLGSLINLLHFLLRLICFISNLFLFLIQSLFVPKVCLNITFLIFWFSVVLNSFLSFWQKFYSFYYRSKYPSLSTSIFENGEKLFYRDSSLFNWNDGWVSYQWIWWRY